MNSIWDGKAFLLDHVEHLVREVEHLRAQGRRHHRRRTLIKEHDSGGIYTTIAMLEFRIKQLRENLDRL